MTNDKAENTNIIHVGVTPVRRLFSQKEVVTSRFIPQTGSAAGRAVSQILGRNLGFTSGFVPAGQEFYAVKQAELEISFLIVSTHCFGC